MDFEKLAKPFLKQVRPYKAGRPIEEVQREKGTDLTFVKLASNENPNPPHDEVKNAVIEMMSEVNRYPESGCYDLVQKLAEVHQVSEEEIFVGNGSNEIIDLLTRAFVFPDENIVYPWPSFVIYKLVSVQCDIEGRAVPCRDNRLDLKAMAEAVDDKTKIVYICNPNNPTSTYVGLEEFNTFLESIPESTLVVLDEAYYEYVTATDYPQTVEMRRRHPALVTLRTFSKVHALAGLRIGYAVADRQVVQVLHKMRQPFNVNRLANAAALAALRCRDKIQASIDQVVIERERLRKVILDIGWDCPPSQTNFLYVIPIGYSGDAAEPFLERGVIIRNMAPFGSEGNIFRLTVGTPEENDRFIKALEEILTRSS